MSNLFFALVPLVAFYAAEAQYGLAAGVMSAMGFSVLQLGWEWFTRRKINRLVLFSAALVCGLGGMSLLSEDERFVLWTPVVGDLVFSGVLFGGLFTSPPLHEIALTDADPELELDEDMRSALRGMVIRMGLNLVLHAVITAWATTQSREVWLFVSGPVQYGQLGVQLVGEFLWARFAPVPDEGAGGGPPTPE